jgi:hypothetical protein
LTTAIFSSLARVYLGHWISYGIGVITAAHTIAVASDIKVVVGSITAGIILLMQGVNLWRSLVNGKNINHASLALHNLHNVVDEDIRSSLEALKKQNEAMTRQQAEIARTTAYLEKLIERRKASPSVVMYRPERRAAPEPEAPRPAPPRVVEPLHDPKAGNWPIGNY